MIANLLADWLQTMDQLKGWTPNSLKIILKSDLRMAFIMHLEVTIST